MGHVTAIGVPGLDLWFNSSDHLPPHFHARRPGEWEIRVYILETTGAELAYSPRWPPGVRPPARLLAALRRAVVGNRLALLAEWEQKVVVSGDTP